MAIPIEKYSQMLAKGTCRWQEGYLMNSEVLNNISQFLLNGCPRNMQAVQLSNFFEELYKST
jgi:hypothetical protein